jgi:hypothetical protein
VAGISSRLTSLYADKDAPLNTKHPDHKIKTKEWQEELHENKKKTPSARRL